MFLKFEVTGNSDSGKTTVSDVRSATDGTLLGAIKWYGPWRKYCFYSSQDTIWDQKCLLELSQELELMNKNKRSWGAK